MSFPQKLWKRYSVVNCFPYLLRKHDQLKQCAKYLSHKPFRNRKKCINSEEFSQKAQFSWDHPGENFFIANAVLKLQCQHIVSEQFFKSRKMFRCLINLINLEISFLNPTELLFQHLFWECYMAKYIPTFVVGKLPQKLLHMISFP